MTENLISLYFHIPFCTKKCDYCHFYVLPDKDFFKIQLLEGFGLELDQWAPHLAGKKLVSIYFGGGTPSLFGAGPLNKLLKKIHSHIPFDAERIEITLEANPDLLTRQLMQEYADAGVNRISIGIQTLDDELLKRLGRTHNRSAALDAAYLTSDAGISNVSVDLMYDIPGQTLRSWQNTLVQVSALPITHLSLYNLTIEPQTVFFKYREALRKELPDAESSTQMYRMAQDTFEACGLKQYEISAFARNDLYSRHNVGYWTARPFLGFGPSAFSYWEDRRFRNVANLNRYLKALKEGLSPVDFDEALDPVKRRRELLAIALRLRKGVDCAAFEKQHGALDAATYETLQNLEKGGLIERSGNVIALSQRGILFYDTVAVEII